MKPLNDRQGLSMVFTRFFQCGKNAETRTPQIKNEAGVILDYTSSNEVRLTATALIRKTDTCNGWTAENMKPDWNAGQKLMTIVFRKDLGMATTRTFQLQSIPRKMDESVDAGRKGLQCECLFKFRLDRAIRKHSMKNNVWIEGLRWHWKSTQDENRSHR